MLQFKPGVRVEFMEEKYPFSTFTITKIKKISIVTLTIVLFSIIKYNTQFKCTKAISTITVECMEIESILHQVTTLI